MILATAIALSLRAEIYAPTANLNVAEEPIQLKSSEPEIVGVESSKDAVTQIQKISISENS